MWWRGEGRGGEEANRVIALSRDGADSEGSSARGWHVISQFRSSASQGPGHTSLPFLILCGPYAQLLFSILLQLHSLPERQTLGHLQQMSKWCTGHVTREEYITGTKDKKKAKKSKALKKKKKITLSIQEMVLEQSAHRIPRSPLKAPRLFWKVNRTQTR